MNLEGKRAICLAGSQGLGEGIATEFVLAGAQVLIVSRSSSNLDAAAAAIRGVLDGEGAGPGVSEAHEPSTLAVDLLAEDAPDTITEAAVDRFGGVDILVNNIGGPSPGRLADLDDAAWQDGYDQLIRAYVRQFRSCLPWLQKSSAPRVLTVTSISSRQPIDGLILSNTFRAGLVGLTKTLAREYAGDGILINNLAPGMFDTGRLRELDAITAKQKGLDFDEVRRQRMNSIPIGRYGEPRELGKVATFLASSWNTLITGQTLLVDGGLYGGL